jgi:hypothetical protein
MSPIQKKHRIKKLWKKAKRVYLFQKLSIRHISDERREAKRGKDFDDFLDRMDDGSAKEWRWFIIRQENALPQFWSFIINLLTIYALFLTPLDLVFP